MSGPGETFKGLTRKGRPRGYAPGPAGDVVAVAAGEIVALLGEADGAGPTRTVLGTGVAGEFWPIVVISVFLTGVYGAAAEVLLLLAFSLVSRSRPRRSARSSPSSRMRASCRRRSASPCSGPASRGSSGRSS